MFDRFIRLSQAKAALREARFEDALRIAADPLLRDTRQGERLIESARRGLLDRAAQRLRDGDLAAARAVHGRLDAAARNGQVEEFGRTLAAAERAAQQDEAELRAVVAEARELIGQGRLEEAEAALAAERGNAGSVAVVRLRGQIEDRKRRSAEAAAEAAAALDRGDAAAARIAVGRALALAPSSDAANKELGRVRTALMARHQEAVRSCLRSDDLLGALAAVRTAATDNLGESPQVWLGSVTKELQCALVAAVRSARSLAAGASLAAAVRGAGLEVGEPLAGLFMALLEGPSPAGNAAAARGILAAAELLDAPDLVASVRPMLAIAERADAALREAQQVAAAGDLDAARERLVAVLADQPLHEGLRRELAGIEQGLGARHETLQRAQACAREGRLAEATALALAVGAAGRVGAEAQVLLTDVRGRAALVQRGIDEVRSALHGRAACSLQGVRHCLARLDALAKVQQDHAELGPLRAMVAAEIESLDALDAVDAALARNDVDAALAGVGTVLSRRERLLAAVRLDARLLAIGDQLVAMAGAALAVGEVFRVDAICDTLTALAVLGGDIGGEASRLRAERKARGEEAAAQIADGRRLLAGKDLEGATACLAEAAELWPESPEVRAFAAELAGLRAHAGAVADAVALAAERDHRGAADRMAALPPTPALLRTKVFDMKQQLARAQGLEGAFLLRVDEGGEHLVLRGESIAIGNIQKRTADLPILANLAGRHAVVRRSMSFHGGMEDAVVAEDGEVRVGGAVVAKHVLAPGDRVQLGATLSFVYQRPSRRSLSVGLVLQGGFQVAGTDRVLLMKDRGRDGRILLGAAADVHVRVPSATGEVEVFATGNGQIRVAAPQGTLDGSAFRGEATVMAGQVVTACGISFVLLPWAG